MKRRSEKQKEMDRLRRQCHKLAKKLNCEIQNETFGYRNPVYWVYGPGDLYQIDYTNTDTGERSPALRDDPYVQHSHRTWGAVKEALEVYQEDILLYYLDIREASVSCDIIRSSPLWETYWRTLSFRPPASATSSIWEHDRGLVMADWLEEAGEIRLAGQIRERVERLMGK